MCACVGIEGQYCCCLKHYTESAPSPLSERREGLTEACLVVKAS